MEKNLYGCFKIDGKQSTIQGRCYCIAETMEEAVRKSFRLLDKGIETVIRKI